MGTIATDEVLTDEIQGATGAGSITIGGATFPGSDSTPRSVASFGNAAFFVPNSSYQHVSSTTATVQPATTVVGVNFDGQVQLTLPNTSLTNQILVVDEGGFCSAVNTISATSTAAFGSLVLSTPYSHLRITTSNGSPHDTQFFSEARELGV